MRFLSFITATLVAVAFAAPGEPAKPEKRTWPWPKTCLKDKCKLKVIFSKNGKKDCSFSFELHTSTITAPCTVTGSPNVGISTIVVTETQLSTNVQPLTEVISLPTAVVTNVETIVISETLFRRRTDPTPTCAATTSKPSKVPSHYCGHCKRPADFAAGCACLGVKPTTTTLPAVTITSAISSCVTVTPTSLVTVVTTVTVSSVVEQTQIITSTLEQVTATEVSTVVQTIFPPAPTSTTCFRLRVTSQSGAISHGINVRDPLIFDREAISFPFGSPNPSLFNVINAIQGRFLYAAPSQSPLGGGNLDGVRLTTDRNLASNFECRFEQNRFTCRSLRDPSTLKTQLYRCNFQNATPPGDTEVFIGTPGTEGGCVPLIDIIPVIRTSSICS